MSASFALPDVTARSAAIRLADSAAQSFTFVPYVRVGAAAGIRTLVGAAPGRAEMAASLRLDDGVEGGVTVPAPRIYVRGPGDVIGIDAAQIIRRHPVPGTGNAPTGDLVHIEFDQPDLPWMFTPGAPQNGRLAPWLRLVVVPTAAIMAERPPEGAELPPWVEVPRSELPPAAEGWAWAHAQVSGRDLDPAALQERLGSGAPQLNLSRIVSPRRLLATTAYTALLVPAFLAGVEAARGRSDAAAMAHTWAWEAGEGAVSLPVYDRWEFSTGENLGFEELARKIVPVPPPEGVGRRLVDTTQPGCGIAADDQGGPREVSGALVAARRVVPGQAPPPPSRGAWDADRTEQLARLLDPPTSEDDPEVGPPLYGGAHIARDRVPDPDAEPAWLRELNVDPAHRIAAALGAAIVQMDQEPLMAASWSQLENVRAANGILRMAQLSLFAQTALHARTLERMLPGDVLGVTARAQGRLIVDAGSTARGTVGASALPPAAISAAARRLMRPLGRSARFVPVAERLDRVVGTVAEGDVGADWVLPIGGPQTRTDPGLLQRLETGEEGAGVLGGAPDDTALAALIEVIDALPTPDEAAALGRIGDPGWEQSAEEVVSTLAVGWAILGSGRPDWLVPGAALARFPDAGIAPEERGPIPADVIAFGVFEPVWSVLATAGFGLFDPHRGGVVGEGEPPGLSGIAIESLGEAVVDEPDPVELPRPRLDLGALDLVGRLRPALTVPRRAGSRLPGLGALLGRPDDAIDPVMAAPVIRHPLYEALNRKDPEWLMPGVAAIPQPDMVTALETNAAFVQAFLTGANHEFSRELVWREYPTDGRGTSLRHFWTTEPDLYPLHTLVRGALGEGVDEARSGKLVLVVRGELVRRFPNLLATATRSKKKGYPVEYTGGGVEQLFRIALSPNLLLVGLDLTAAVVSAEDPDAEAPGPETPPNDPPEGAYWFTLAEHIGAPRFGLDESVATPAFGEARDNLVWSDWIADGVRDLTGLPPAKVIATLPAPLRALAPTSAAVAWALFQKPVRAGYRLAALLAGTKGEGGGG